LTPCLIETKHLAPVASTLEPITARLNRGVRSKKALLSAVGEAAFGQGLTIRSYRLGNGLEVHLLRDDTAPVVSYQTWFRVGSRHEKKNKTGLAHLFEHLMFKETSTYGAGEFDRLLESAGAETNAATWTDWTYYYDNVPSRELELAVKLESDRMQNLVLRVPAVASEKEVVMSERRDRVDNDVEGKANEVLYAQAFTKHPYGTPTIGWMRDIERFNVADCRSFYRTYYAPNNAIVVVAGDFDELETLRLIREHYSVMPSARIPRERRIVEPPQKRERRMTLPQPTDSDKLEIGWRGPAWGDRDFAVLTVLNEVLSGGRSSRLYRALVDDAEKATSVTASPAPFEHPGLFELWADARDGVSAGELLTLVDTEIDRLRKDGVTEDEIDKSKNRLELGFLSSMETASGKGEQLGFAAAVVRDPSAVFRRLAELREVTRSEVRTAARRYLTRTQRNVVFVVPEAEA
jgi:zinc protease